MISFTKSETRVILFIISVLITGFSIRYYKQVISSDSSALFDYTKSDREFKEKSKYADKKLTAAGWDTLKNNSEQLSGYIKASEDSLNSESKVLKEKGLNEYSGAVLNINTAGKNDFVDLPGIGESIAEKIIAYREEKKGFRKIEDLMNVKGIGKKKFEKIKTYIKAE